MSLVRFPMRSDAFSAYRPSQNAHTDFLGPSTLGKRKEGAKAEVKVIKLSIPTALVSSNDESLATLDAAITALLNGRTPEQSFHHISATCHQVVLPPHGLGQKVHENIVEEMGRSISVLAREWRGAVMSREAGWLKRLADGWASWETRVKLLSSVFVYLDRVYAPPASGVPSIRDLSITAFRTGIWDDKILFSKTRDEMIAWAAQERAQQQPDASLRSVVASISALSKVLSKFDSVSETYLDSLIDHYKTEAKSKISSIQDGSMSATRYIQWIVDKVEEERDRARTCLDETIATSAVSLVHEHLGSAQYASFLQPALDEAMDLADETALIQLYTVAVDCNVFGPFRSALHSHINARLRRVISDPANDAQMIDQTLTLRRFTNKAVAALFSRKEIDVEGEGNTASREDKQRQLELEDAVRTGFKEGLGSRQNAPAEWIAKHLDVAMRKGQGPGTEAEFNALLDEIIALIGFTRDKDVFKAFYSTQLAKRLLLNKSASDDMERNMIVKLQNEMGEEFTSGDVMMKDLALSETLVKSYQSAQAKQPELYHDPGNFTANVLTESAWPAYPQLKDGWAFKLTPELQTSIEQFTRWYSEQHKNRQLSWRWQLATVSLTARFPSGRYEVGVSMFQAVVLLQFNADDTLSFAELKERTGIEQSELVRCVQSLSMGRKGTRVLLKKPPGKEVNPTDQVIWNKAFTADRVKFKINQIQQDMSAEESKKTNEQVAIDRVSVLEATMVRIMKGRKKMTMQLLVDAVVVDVSKRFPPDVKEIKKRMESLIEREFLMRDEDDRNLLHYLA